MTAWVDSALAYGRATGRDNQICRSGRYFVLSLSRCKYNRMVGAWVGLRLVVMART